MNIVSAVINNISMAVSQLSASQWLNGFFNNDINNISQ